MTRTRILHERSVSGVKISLTDSADNPNEYRLVTVIERNYTEYFRAMDGLRKTVAEVLKDHAISV